MKPSPRLKLLMPNAKPVEKPPDLKMDVPNRSTPQEPIVQDPPLDEAELIAQRLRAVVSPEPSNFTPLVCGDTIPVASAVTRSECIACHADEGKRTYCDSCHRTIGRDWQPPNHAFNWNVQHGQVERSGDNSNLNKCGLCHSQPFECKSCHDHEAPLDHTGLRSRLTAIAAQPVIDETAVVRATRRRDQ